MSQNVKFKKNISTFSLMMTGVTSIVGSGWLLATQKITDVAGPAGVLAWFIGMLVAIIIACFCIEIGTVNPSAGGIGYYSGITHGRFSGFITQWVNWLSILAVPAVEAQAIVQYLSKSNKVFHSWYDLQEHVLTPSGITIAILFMLLFMSVNYWGSKLFIRFNNALTVIKIIIPVLTIVFLIHSGFNSTNFGDSMASFVPYGWSAIGSAVISCGVVMSFNGFQLPLNFSEEIESPKRQLPIAIIGSIIFTFILYVALQTVFIGAVTPEKLIHGWHGVHYRSPYVELLLAANLQVMAWAVMSTSVIAPTACGAAFVASASRMIFTLSCMKLLPKFLNKLDHKYHVPRSAIVTNVILGGAFLFMFKGWAQLVAVISILHIFSYLSMPIVVIAYRQQQKTSITKVDNFRLPCALFFAILILFVLSLLLFFAAWPGIGYMAILLIPGLIFFFYYEYQNHGTKDMWSLVKSGSWILYFMLGIIVICYLGNNKEHVTNIISLSTSIVLLAILSVTSFIYGVFSSLKTPDLN